MNIAFQKTSGQSLAEFAIGTSVLVLIMVAGVYIAMGMYHGQMASDAIREPIFHRLVMAQEPGAVSEGELLTMTRVNSARGNLNDGSKVDSLDVFQSGSSQTAIIVGKKTFNNPVMPLQFSVSQGISKNLLAANTGSSESPTVTPPVMPPPWEAAPEVRRMGSGLPCNQSSTLGDEEAESLANNEGTYLSRAPFSVSAPMPQRNVMELAQNYMGECANIGAGVCNQEYQDFLPEEVTNSVSVSGGHGPSGEGVNDVTGLFIYKNPPGMPGYEVFIYYVMGPEDSEPRPMPYENDPIEPLPAIRANPNHGMYIDPGGEYRRPPASMVPDCKKRKQAECALDAAARRATEIYNQYSSQCNGL